MSDAVIGAMRISRKLQLLINTVGLLAAVSIGILGYVRAKEALLKATQAKLWSILDDRHAAMDTWFRGIRGDILVQASNPLVFQALRAYRQGWEEIQGNKTEFLQKLYIHDNPNPTGKKRRTGLRPRRFFLLKGPCLFSSLFPQLPA